MKDETIVVKFRGNIVTVFHRPPILFASEAQAFDHYNARTQLIYGCGMYPCPYCYGSGKVVDKDDYDAVEGYKNARMLECQPCDGRGTIDKYAFKAFYDRLTDQINERRQEVAEAYADLIEVLEGLTAKQFDILSAAFARHASLNWTDEPTSVYDVLGRDELGEDE